MERDEFLELMQFPPEWKEWGMYPDALFKLQMADYYPGSEEAPEHFRFGAFIWWIRKPPDSDECTKLFDLASRDPDKLMAEDAKSRLRKL